VNRDDLIAYALGLLMILGGAAILWLCAEVVFV
jgi:hypothetical protein